MLVPCARDASQRVRAAALGLLSCLCVSMPPAEAAAAEAEAEARAAAAEAEAAQAQAATGAAAGQTAAVVRLQAAWRGLVSRRLHAAEAQAAAAVEALSFGVACDRLRAFYP